MIMLCVLTYSTTYKYTLFYDQCLTVNMHKTLFMIRKLFVCTLCILHCSDSFLSIWIRHCFILLKMVYTNFISASLCQFILHSLCELHSCLLYSLVHKICCSMISHLILFICDIHFVSFLMKKQQLFCSENVFI